MRVAGEAPTCEQDSAPGHLRNTVDLIAMNWDLLIRGNSVTQTLAVSFRSILICINDFGNLTMKVCDDLTFSSKLLQSFTFCKSLIVVYLQERSILH